MSHLTHVYRLKKCKKPKKDGSVYLFIFKFSHPDAASGNCYCRFVIKIMLGVQRSLTAANSRLAKDFDSFIRRMTRCFQPPSSVLFFFFPRRSFTLLVNKVASGMKVGLRRCRIESVVIKPFYSLVRNLPMKKVKPTFVKCW